MCLFPLPQLPSIARTLSRFSHVQIFETLWTVALQAPLSLGFSRQDYWSGLPCPPLGDLPNPGIEARSPALQADSLPSEPLGKPQLSQIWFITWFQGYWAILASSDMRGQSALHSVPCTLTMWHTSVSLMLHRASFILLRVFFHFITHEIRAGKLHI